MSFNGLVLVGRDATMQGECKNHDGAEANGMIVVPVLGVAWLVCGLASHKRVRAIEG